MSDIYRVISYGMGMQSGRAFLREEKVLSELLPTASLQYVPWARGQQIKGNVQLAHAQS